MKKPTKPVKSEVERRLDRLERAVKYFSDGLWRVSDEVMTLRAGKSNPQRKRLEQRVFVLENKFFAFQCGAQAQMEKDRAELAQEERRKAREALGAREEEEPA